MKRAEMLSELADAAGLINSTSAAHLAYTAADGTPRVIPIGFFWTGEQFVLASATTSPKVAALRDRPEVALTIDAGGTPGDARTVSIRGRAHITIVDGVVDEYLAAAHKSMKPDEADEFEAGVKKMYPQQARIAITPAWVRYYDFGSGRMPTFLKKLAENQPSD